MSYLKELKAQMTGHCRIFMPIRSNASKGFTARMGLRTLALTFSGLLFTGAATAGTNAHTEQLPSLGHASSELISLDKERRLGQHWLRSLRSQVKTYQEPIVTDYLAQLVYSLAPNSSVVDKDFSFVIVDSQALNAFAVPGSVIGVNAGLFIHALSEQEFASVIAHELAHIGQRHYARRLEQQQKNAPLSLAGLLASIAIIAAAGADAGVAALASTQALSAEKALAFSRQNEEEADRLGIQTMYASGYNPRAMPIMFERMYKRSRLQGSRLPEYLSTHPLTDSRVSDTRNRATQYPRRQYTDSIEYHICRSIIIKHYAESPRAAQQYFSSLIAKGNTQSVDGARFGLALALTQNEPNQAVEILEDLMVAHPGQIAIALALSEALMAQGKPDLARALLLKLNNRSPTNYPVQMALAMHYNERQDYASAQASLQQLSKQMPEQPKIWYELAEVSGKNGDINTVHHARAEYFLLHNRFKSALEQFDLALEKVEPGSAQALRLQARKALAIRLQKQKF